LKIVCPEVRHKLQLDALCERLDSNLKSRHNADWLREPKIREEGKNEGLVHLWEWRRQYSFKDPVVFVATVAAQRHQ
jgi:hypothetical protein